jgi:hypothetical protein
MFQTKAWLFTALLILVFVTLLCVSGNRVVFGQFQSPPEIIIQKPVLVESSLPDLFHLLSGALIEVKVVTGETFRGIKIKYPSSLLVLELQETGERVAIIPHHIVYFKVLRPPSEEKR